jgi:hypothetical protein
LASSNPKTCYPTIFSESENTVWNGIHQIMAGLLPRIATRVRMQIERGSSEMMIRDELSIPRS